MPRRRRTRERSIEQRPIAGSSRVRLPPSPDRFIDLTASSDDEIQPLDARHNPPKRARTSGRLDEPDTKLRGLFAEFIESDDELFEMDPAPGPALPPVEPDPLLPEPEPVFAPVAEIAPAPLEAPALAAEPVPLLVQVLEIVPDVDPAHAQTLLDARLAEGDDEGHAVQRVLHALFDTPDYPRLQRGNKNKKRKRSEDAIANENKDKGKSKGKGKAKDPKVDYANIDRPFEGGPLYSYQALEALQVQYPLVPKPDVRKFLIQHNKHYAPTSLFLQRQSELPPNERLYTEKRTKYKGTLVNVTDPALVPEVEWINRLLNGEGQAEDEDMEAGPSKGKGKDKEEPEEEAPPDSTECDESDGGVECGCCFGTYVFDTLIQCPDAHLFCVGCVRSYVEGKLGEGASLLKCMSANDPPCEMIFGESILNRILKASTLRLYHRVCARRDLQAAGLDDLEECPFCDYAVVVENPDEKLFRCQREDCAEVSCRKCKKQDHLPKSCEEAAKDNKLGAQHAVEEAMTKALLRHCPKCQNAFIKELGCNKMVCTSCATMSCYVCRKIITGYEHFKQMPGGQQRPKGMAPGTCPLFDGNNEMQPDARHNAEIAAARERALREVAAENPDIDAEEIKVDMPSPARGAPAPGPAVPIRGQAVPFNFLDHVLAPAAPRQAFAPRLDALRPDIQDQQRMFQQALQRQRLVNEAGVRPAHAAPLQARLPAPRPQAPQLNFPPQELERLRERHLGAHALPMHLYARLADMRAADWPLHAPPAPPPAPAALPPRPPAPVVDEPIRRPGRRAPAAPRQRQWR